MAAIMRDEEFLADGSLRLRKEAKASVGKVER